MEIPRSDKITKQKVPTPHAADDMPLWDGHFLIVGKCSEEKVRNVKKYFIHVPAWNGGPFQGQYRIILSADTASEVRQMPSQKRR